MNKPFIFDGDISPKSVSRLIDNVEASNVMLYEEPEITLYMSTNGGFVSYAYALSHYLIGLMNKGCILNVIITESCHSSGLFFLMDIYSKSLECQRCVNLSFFKYSTAILHEIAVTLHSRNDNKQMPIILTEMKERRANVLKFFKKHLTKSEIVDFNTGGDVELGYERLGKIFNAKIIETC